jgi:hypothetical protein
MRIGSLLFAATLGVGLVVHLEVAAQPAWPAPPPPAPPAPPAPPPPPAAPAACGIPPLACCPNATCNAPSTECRGGTCVPVLPTGAPCVASPQCAAENECISSRCTRVGGHGQHCAAASPRCRDQNTCHRGFCMSPGERGGPCRTQGTPCDGNVQCVSGTCGDSSWSPSSGTGVVTSTKSGARGGATPAPALVQPAPIACSADKLCSAGVCFQGLCRMDPRGQACTSNTSCANLTTCSKPTPSSTTGTCEFAGGYYQVCRYASACDNGAECRDNQCVPVGYSGLACRSGQQCTGSGVVCLSGVCRHTGLLGEPCGSGNTCSQSVCRSGVCVKP